MTPIKLTLIFPKSLRNMLRSISSKLYPQTINTPFGYPKNTTNSPLSAYKYLVTNYTNII